MSHKLPPKWTGMTARVRSVTAASTAVRSMVKVSGRTSTSTGRIPRRRGAVAVATKV